MNRRYLHSPAAPVACALPACGSPGSAARRNPCPPGAAVDGVSPALVQLVQLYAERLTTAEKVAAAKWGTAKPIDDPPRERQVLDAMAARADRLGVDRTTVRRIFSDQIEANKVVQRGLHRSWERHPSRRPAACPDLAQEIRPELDRIGTSLLQAIRTARPQLAHAQCASSAAARAARQVIVAMRLDPLHQQGLHRALAHTYTPAVLDMCR